MLSEIDIPVSIALIAGEILYLLSEITGAKFLSSNAIVKVSIIFFFTLMRCKNKQNLFSKYSVTCVLPISQKVSSFAANF